MGENMGTEIKASASTLTLQWEDWHGWDKQLTRGGLELYAEYATASQGLVRERLGRSQAVQGRRIQIALPATLKGQPSGPVCLYLQLPGRGNLLPVRRAESSGTNTDTARFRYEAWEKWVKSNGLARMRQEQLGAMQSQLQQLDAQLAQSQAALQQRGWSSMESCASAQMKPQSTATTAPVGVIPEAKHESAARQVCVARMAYARAFQNSLIKKFVQQMSQRDPQAKQSLLTASQLAGQTASLAERILQMKPASQSQATSQVIQERQREAREFLHDWQTHLPGLQRKEPLLYGDIGNPATIISSAESLQAQSLLHALLEGEPSDASVPALQPTQQLALAGSMLDSYRGCVTDARRELQSRLTTWQELQRDGPERQRRLSAYMVQSCQDAFTRLQASQQERTQFAAELDALRSRPQADDSSDLLARLNRVQESTLNQGICQ